MNHPVITALLPVVLFILAGFVAGRRRWIGGGAVRDLSNLVFMLLLPALLFRTMSAVHLEQLDFKPIGMYFLAASLVYALVLLVQGYNRRGAVLALAGTFSNTGMIGIPLIGLAYGQPGLVTLFTLISLHSLVLLTAGNIVLELAAQREDRLRGIAPAHSVWVTVLRALRNGIIHPIPLPIMAGLLFGLTGLSIPPLLDQPLQLLGSAMGPMALVLVGVTLAYGSVGAQLKGALAMVGVKNLLHPAMVGALGWLLGLGGVPLTVMVVTAGLPIGANVYLFSQRYGVAEDLTTASVAVTTVMALVTLPLVMLLAGHL
ncbi:AEC family transporter [Curvibacter sp. RS43]|uniref:AEC family transporter n=1 Tax=Curvibacter microcysteis TaxID=3026419 RepID=A0ABT5MGI6_9BURK|nr:MULTISPECIES: AEC family transporter [unclassified Curvibacter]MDD0809852.1 AEC family transporter [Curvibacter sp. RS43]MDD0815027.1 AEC family transporter [Curvibacter sp. HBC28]